MEHSFSDFLSKAFSDMSVPCDEEGELDFESLNLHEGNMEKNDNGEFERLPVLTEVDKTDDPEEGNRSVSVGMSEEEPLYGESVFPQGVDWGETVLLVGHEVEDGLKFSAEDETVMDDTDTEGLSSLSDTSQMINIRRDDPSDSEESAGNGEQAEDLDDRLPVLWESSAEGPGVERPRMDESFTGSDSEHESEEEDRRSPKDESQGHEGSDLDVGTNENANTGTVVDTDHKTDMDAEVAAADDVADVDAVTNTEMNSEAWVSGFSEESSYSAVEDPHDDLLQAPPLDLTQGEMREFSEADCGLIVEGYAEYPSEEEEEDKDEEEYDDGRGSGRLSETLSSRAGAELSGWEVMEGVVEGFEEPVLRGNEGVAEEGRREEEDGSRGGNEVRNGADSDEEKEMEVSDASSSASEGDAKALDVDSECESSGAHKEQVLGWTDSQRNNDEDTFNQRKEDNEDYDESIYKTLIGEELDPGKDDDLRLNIQLEQDPVDEEQALHSITQGLTDEDKEDVPVIPHEQAFAEEEDVCPMTNVGETLEAGSGVTSKDGLGGILIGGVPEAASIPVSVLDHSSSESESSSSEAEPWLYQSAAPATPRGPSSEPSHLLPGTFSPPGEATDLLWGPKAYGGPTAKEEEFENEEEEGDDEGDEAERNWGQERERIQAFYRYYDDDEVDHSLSREGQGSSDRKHMVRFCLDILPGQRDSPSSDSDMLSSSSAGMEDSDTAEPEPLPEAVPGAVPAAVPRAGPTAVPWALPEAVPGAVPAAVPRAGPTAVPWEFPGEVYSEATQAVTETPEKTEGALASTVRPTDHEREIQRENLSLLLQTSQAAQTELKKLRDELKTQHQQNRVPAVLMWALKMILVSVVGVLMFWWATDQLDWTGPDWST